MDSRTSRDNLLIIEPSRQLSISLGHQLYCVMFLMKVVVLDRKLVIIYKVKESNVIDITTANLVGKLL